MKSWRAKPYTFRLNGTRKLVVTVRRFKTAKANRSRVFKQLVVPVPYGSVKEIACRLQRQGRRRKGRGNSFWRLSASLPLLLFAMGLLGSGFFGSHLVHAQSLEPVKTFASVAPLPHVAAHKFLPYSEPTHIAIPAVGVDADTIAVGQASDGSIETPPILDWTTGWYKYSPTPGQMGPAVIVGHVDTYQGVSVFWNLRYVKAGDLVNVTRADGSAVHFKVTALAQYDKSNFPAQTVYGDTTDAELRLITCGGSFDAQTESYTQNTVVYATATP